MARAATGAELYDQHCAACHQAGGTGVPGVFPPLAGNAALADAEHVRSVIEKGLSGPLQVGGATFDGSMPPFGAQLGAAEVQSLADYLRSAWGNGFAGPSAGGGTAATPAASTPPAAPSTAPAAPAGDASVGHALFSGELRFRNGAPPCSACHAVQRESPLGGGSMGRDLTTAYDRMGQSTGLQGVLKTIAFPVMRQTFASHPLTDAEIADLVAYLRETASAAHAHGTAGADPARFGFNWIWLFAAVGAPLLFALLLIGWPRQRESASERLRRTGRVGRPRR